MLFPEYVKCKDEAAVCEKIRNIEKDGISHLHFISDFDMTMTQYYNPKTGTRSVSSHGILALSSLAAPEFRALSKQLYDKYYPIEISHSVSFREKFAAMQEWTDLANKSIVAHGFTKSDIAAMVKEIPVCFRPGAHELVNILTTHDIPMLVISAGLGDVIAEIMRQNDFLIPSLHIVSNMMKFNDDDRCIAFHDPLIHIFNKNEASIQGTAYGRKIEGRRNVILMGDSLGDPHMSAGMKHNVELKIGYLNHDVDILMEQYLQVYDIVIEGDRPMNFVNQMLQEIVNKKD